MWYNGSIIVLDGEQFVEKGGTVMRKNLKRKMAVLMTAAIAWSSLSASSVYAEESNQVRSFLTGKPVDESIGRQRAIAVMYNNIEAALPQSGIANAEVVYEAPVEGGITRLMGILEDYKDVERIGSVRSCRDYYIYFAREFDAYYMHFGQAVYAQPLLDRSETLNIDGLRSGSSAYYRSDDFVAPHNVYTNYDMIQSTLDRLGYAKEYSENYLAQDGHYQFAEDGVTVTLENGADAAVAVPGYSYNDAYFVYDAETGKYTRYQYGDLQIDKLTNASLEYDNIIFQYCSWQNYDENGYLNIDPLSGGSGKYITKGKAIDIIWKKDAVNTENPYAAENFDVTHYYDANGEEITLNQGKTWVCIIQDTYSDDVKLYSELAEFAG